jgi:hypothetical protein
MKWTLPGQRTRKRPEIGIANAGAEANLRAALTAPAAPGEDESYRRLMGVIAEDMRLRRPAAPQRASWSWMPVASVSAAAAILVAFAYTAGVDRGVNMARPPETPRVAVAPSAPKPLVPHGLYVPPAKPAGPPAKAPAATVPPTETPAVADATPMNYIGNIALEGLTRDQRDLLRIYVTQAEGGEWASAARSLERLANTEPGSAVAVTALQGAAEIYRGRLRDNASALDMYQRELKACQDQLAATTDPDRKADLQTHIEQVNTNIAELEPTQ